MSGQIDGQMCGRGGGAGRGWRDARGGRGGGYLRFRGVRVRTTYDLPWRR